MASLYKPVAKKFQYSSQVNKEILERRAADIAELSNSTVSEVIEEALVDQLLPCDEHAAPYVNGILFGKRFTFDGTCVPYGIRDAFIEIFEAVSAGVGWKPRYTNARPLVELAAKLVKERSPELARTSGEPFSALHELDYAFDSLCGVFEKAVGNLEEPGLDAELRWARAAAKPAILSASIEPAIIIDFILRNWTAVENSTHTFRTLSKLLASSTEWEDTAYDRVRFQNTCETVMAEWTRAEKRQSERSAATDTTPKLEQHPIADGGYVLAPSDWVVLNPTVAPYANHAGYIEIKHGERYEAPHFLFFAEHSLDEMTDAEKETLLRLASNAWDGMELVKEDLVELAYSADGGVANKAEYSAAPRIGWFSIFDRGEHPGGRPRYGAEIIRVGNERAGKEVAEE
jgi:hypothetical protein